MHVLIWGFGETALACAEALRAAGHSVTGVARSARVGGEAAERGIRLLQGDLHRPEAVSGLETAFEVVVLAAATKPGDLRRDPWGLYVEGSRALVDFHRGRRPLPAKFIIFSTTSVYGPASVLADGTIDESSPLDPRPKRARGAGGGESIPNHTAAMEDVWRASGLPVILLRLPGIHKPDSEALGEMMERPEFRAPTSDRTYQTINLEALARVVAAVCAEGRPGDVFNATPPRVQSMVARMKETASRRGLSFDWPPEADPANHRMIVARQLKERLGIELTQADG